MVVKWFDSKSVCLASSYVGVHPLSTTRRYNKIKKSRVEVSMLQMVKHYNKHMGCVDRANIFIKISRTHIKTHKWYLNIFSQFLKIYVPIMFGFNIVKLRGTERKKGYVSQRIQNTC